MKAVLFDMDGVLAHYDFQMRLEELSRVTGRSAAEIKSAVWDSGLDYEHDRGRIGATAYLATIKERLACSITRKQWVAARKASMRPYREVLELALQLKGKVKLALLSNNGQLLFEELGQVFPEISQIFAEHGYFSFLFGEAKPHRDAYLGVLKRLGAAPQESLFIDDTDWCIEGAREAGLKVHHFTKAERLRKEFETLHLLL